MYKKRILFDTSNMTLVEVNNFCINYGLELDGTDILLMEIEVY